MCDRYVILLALSVGIILLDSGALRLINNYCAFTELVERAKAMLQSKGVEAPDEE